MSTCSRLGRHIGRHITISCGEKPLFSNWLAVISEVCWFLLGKIGRKDTPALLVIVLVSGKLPVGKSIFFQQKVDACVTGNDFSFSNQSQQLREYKVFPLDQWLPTF